MFCSALRRQMQWVGPWQGNPSLAERSRRPNIRLPTNFFPLSSQHCSLVQKPQLAGPSSMSTIITSRSCAIDRPRPPFPSRRILSSYHHPHEGQPAMTPLLLPRLQFGPPETADPAGPTCVEGISGQPSNSLITHSACDEAAQCRPSSVSPLPLSRSPSPVNRLLFLSSG